MTVLDVMSLVISSGNVVAAALTGPAVVRLRRAAYRFRSGGDLSDSYTWAWARRAQGIGWVALFGAQIMLVGFGFTAGYPGFQFIQPLMIPIALSNFVEWHRQGRALGRGPW